MVRTPGEGVHLPQERGGQQFDSPDHGADAPKLGRRAGRDHQSCALAARDQRAGVGHRGAVAERRFRSDGFGRLVRRGRLAGQRCFLDPEIRGAQEPEIGGNAVAGFNQNDIAERQAFRRNGEPPPVAQDRGLARQHGANRLERFFRPAFLDEADRRVDEDDSEDDHGVESVAQQDGDQRRRQQDIDEQIVELGEHARQQRARLSRRQSVWPVQLEPLGGLGCGQPCGRGLTPVERGLDCFCVPGTLSCRAQSLHLLN